MLFYEVQGYKKSFIGVEGTVHPYIPTDTWGTGGDSQNVVLKCESALNLNPRTGNPKPCFDENASKAS